MNELGVIVMGAAVRVTALAVVGLLALVVLRRRGPSVGALAGSTTLAVMVVVSVLALSPWPRWWSPGRVTEAPVGATPLMMQNVEPTASPDPVAEGRPSPVVAATSIGWSDFVREFRRELADPEPSAIAKPAWRWPAWAASVFLAGLGIASIRLGVGFWAVRTLRSRSRSIDDPALLEMVAALRGEMGLRRAVAIRETAEVATPATVGWRRPVILLPIGWENWEVNERRAVLAHELAHVLRGDYLAGIAAQISLSLHFYHPLAHALARRLRLQQELAADVWGARLSGGRRPYLTTLANLALRQDPRPAAWPARPFLPSRGTFLRRIEMLRDPKILEVSPMPARGRPIIVAGLVAAGLFIAGLRGPGTSDRAVAQEPATPKSTPPIAAQDRPPLDIASASSDAHLAVDIRPITLLQNPEFKKLAGQIAANGPKEVALILSGEIEQILVLGFDRQPVRARPSDGFTSQSAMVFRAVRPYDWKAFLSGKVEEVKGDGFTYLRTGTMPGATCFRILDDRTLLMGQEADVLVPPIGGDRPRGRHGWNDAWSKLTPGPIRVAFDTPWLVRLVQPDRQGPMTSIMRLVSPLLEKTQAYAMTLDAADGLNFLAVATCSSEDAASRVADTVKAILVLARNSLPDLRLSAERNPGESARSLVGLVDALDALLESTRVEHANMVLKVQGKADAATLANAARMLVPAISSSREAARRSQSVNNMKQIALAMYNYNSVNDCFPSAVLYGPDGKTPYSWRVALLPYLEANDVFSLYKFDEPWDGPNNIKLLSRMPAVYRDPSLDDPNPSLTSYFVPVGPETLFPGRKTGTRIAEITDGTSNTILIVEAKRDIPWTKPEDIAIDKDKPLPRFGELHPGGFNAGFADGSVRFIKQSISPIVLRAVFTSHGGEVVSSDSF